MSERLAFVLLLASTPFWVLALNMLVHRLLKLLAVPFNVQKTAFLCVVAGNIPMFLAVWWLALSHLTGDPVELVFGAVFALIVYNMLGVFYFQCFNLSETSLHIHALTSIYLGQEQAPQAEAEYDAASMVAVRLDRLLELGQVRKEGDKYFSTGRSFLFAARLFDFWRLLIRCHGVVPPNSEDKAKGTDRCRAETEWDG